MYGSVETNNSGPCAQPPSSSTAPIGHPRAFQDSAEDHGPDEVMRIIELNEIGHRVPTVTEWLHTHIDNLTRV
jgi:hypothetical protein